MNRPEPQKNRTHSKEAVRILDFDPDENYNDILQRLRYNFDLCWADNQKSPQRGLQGFDILATIGAGSFGSVKLVRNKANGCTYAVKMLIKDFIVKKKQVRHIINEKQILKCLKFPFVINLEFSFKDNECLYLGMPFINGGELFNYLHRIRKLSENHARFYSTQVVLALEYMHSCDLIYRDLKPENIMICKNGYIKLIDFGFAKKVENRTQTLCGTPEYLAPEVIQSKPYGVSADWWAFGILVFEFINGTSPFFALREELMLMYKSICSNPVSIPPLFSEDAKSLLVGLLQIDTTKRLGCTILGSSDVKFHKWFHDIDWFEILNQQITAPYVPTIKNDTDISLFEEWVDTPYAKSKINKYNEVFADF